MEIVWADDWEIGNHKAFFGDDSAYSDGEPDTCEQCTVYDDEGNILASIGCVDDATDEDKAYLEGELLREVYAEAQSKWSEIDRWLSLAP